MDIYAHCYIFDLPSILAHIITHDLVKNQTYKQLRTDSDTGQYDL